ncbi:hypothetical protein JYU34_003314 [Plutella xylostella]|uniref:Uncharacterized protein n=1 Tax=Plutella xylostella TaxID=51655 RepID=A0ABQ7QZU1_PLUXY|nr:hypothetical protein JYU34_003314 [Plutella xylostella]
MNEHSGTHDDGGKRGDCPRRTSCLSFRLKVAGSRQSAGGRGPAHTAHSAPFTYNTIPPTTLPTLPTEELVRTHSLSARMADDAATDCLFERLRLLHARAGDSTELARALTARIHCRLTSHDKHVRQSTLDRLWNKQTGAMQVLLAILDSSRDIPTCSSIASILRETLCVKQTKAQQKKTTSSIPNEVQGNRKKDSKKAGKENKAPVVKRAVNPARQQCLLQLVSDGATLVLLRALMFAHYKRDGNLSNDLLTADLAWTLAILAPRDPKFALRARTAGAVRAFHLILKGHFTDNKLIFPLLVIMKQLSKNCKSSFNNIP